MPESIGCASVGFVLAAAEGHLAVPQGVRLPASDAGLLVRFVFCHPSAVPPRSLSLACFVALAASALGCRTKARSCEVALEGLATLTRDVDAVVAIEPKNPRLKSEADAAQFGVVAARLEALARGDGPATAPLLVQLVRHVREQDALLAPAMEWVRARAAEMGATPVELSRRQHLRQAADHVSVGNAISTLRFMPKKGAEIVLKVLESAVANAENNNGADIDELKVHRIMVDEAPVLKRFAARAKGRGARIVKRNSHITVVVSDGRKD